MIYQAKAKGMVKKGVQFEIDPLVWEKFTTLCHQGDGENYATSQGQLVSELIADYCALHFTKEDEAANRSFPNLIGS